MTRLVEYRPGCFAREGERARGQDGHDYVFRCGMWRLRKPPGWVSDELLPFPVASTDKPLTLAWGWETNQ